MVVPHGNVTATIPDAALYVWAQPMVKSAFKSPADSMSNRPKILVVNCEFTKGAARPESGCLITIECTTSLAFASPNTWHDECSALSPLIKVLGGALSPKEAAYMEVKQVSPP